MLKPVSALPKSSAPAAELALPITLRLSDQLHSPVAAHIRRVNTGFFLVACPIAVKPEQRVQIALAGRMLETQVVYCHPQSAGDFQLGLQMVQDKDQPLRAEPRIPMDLPAEMSVAGMDSPFQARLVNISSSGLGLDTDRQIAPGEMACVKLDIGLAFGEIRHCTKISSGYRVGLKLDEFIASGNEAQAAKNRATAAEKPGTFARLFGLKNSSRS